MLLNLIIMVTTIKIIMTTAVDVQKKETDNKMDDDNDDLMFVFTMTKPYNSSVSCFK